MSTISQENNPSKAFIPPKASKAIYPTIVTPLRKVLIITYYWPPSGGAGVQRWLKFAKYLPEFGWEPVILTVDPEYAAYPVKDYSFVSEVSDSFKVHKTKATDYFSIYRKDKTKIPSAGFANNLDNSIKGKLLRFIRGNFFIPDPRRGWNKYAFKKATQIIEQESISHIVTTSPPHSTQLIGLRLKKRFPKLHWHCDLRDPWTDIYYYKKFYPTLISKSIDRYYEKTVLRNADSISVTSPTQKKLYTLKLPTAGNKIFIVANGFDESDFTGIVKTQNNICTITYIGTLSDMYPLEGFLKALVSLRETGTRFILTFTGLVSSNRKTQISEVLGTQDVVFNEYVEHKEAIRMMVNSTILLLILPDVEGNTGIIPGKLFEYIATGNPVLCLGPVNSDVAVILNSSGYGQTFAYDDNSSIREFILRNNSVKQLQSMEQKNALKYSRKYLCKEIGKILEI